MQKADIFQESINSLSFITMTQQILASQNSSTDPLYELYEFMSVQSGAHAVAILLWVHIFCVRAGYHVQSLILARS